MKTQQLSNTNSGVKAEGTWNEICNFLKDFESTAEKHIDKEKSVEDLNRWRPREDEEDIEVTRKTAEEASMKKRGVEKKCEGCSKELHKASKKINRSVEEVRRGENPSKELKSASKNICRAMGIKSIESLRKAEKFIYEKFMIKFNSCYFDTENFSINLKRKTDGIYKLKVSIPDEKLRKNIKKEVTGVSGS